MSHQAYRGRLARLYLADLQDPESFELVAGLRSNAVSLDNDLQDATTLDSQGFRELLPDAGVQRLTIEAEGLANDSAAWARLQASAVARQVERARVTFDNGDRFQGDVCIARFVRTGSYNEAETFSLTLESSGPVSFTTGGGTP
ncbi:phage tail tube protein [Fodinicurvata halophila]|uniref:Phage tail tube protein n=1 Tax=Fodinicurvata halophila TaxID=1419723 RepID=A0ABV8UR83_9PROT